MPLIDGIISIIVKTLSKGSKKNTKKTYFI